MSGFQQVTIGGYPGGGLTTDKKPLMIADEAFSSLQNAYVFRDRTKKREGTVGVGRLARNVSSSGTSSAGTTTVTFNLFTVYSITEPNAQIKPGSYRFTIGAPDAATFVDNGLGGFTVTGKAVAAGSTINYTTGAVTLNFSPALTGGGAITTSAVYFPLLPVMGILKEDTFTIGIDNTIYFDTKYAYQFVGGNFQELVPGTTWTGTNTDFFWAANYQGSTPDLRFFFVTNNNLDKIANTFDPIRYYNPLASTWTALTPLVSASNSLYQALIIIPYYGRLLALNVWEGASGDYHNAVNFYSRVRFSQIGDPTAADSWRSDIFGLGGFIDAPTNEAIVSAAFFRNTLIIFFEYSTWQLRYVGEYGLPFIFERISSDFGAVSTYSSIVFDQGVMAVSDRGIIEAGAGGVKRLDEQIPENIFSFEIQNKGPNFVHGIRDFEKELVYWNYLDSSDAEETQSYPTTVLLFNYRNNTWAQFRDTITCFGIGQFQFAVTWDSLTTFWESEASWDNVDDQAYVDYVTAGNQQGYISIYENQDASTTIPAPTMFAPSLSITAIDFTMSPAVFTVPEHNLANGEIIYITGALWSGTDPGINNIIYNVTIIDSNTFTLGLWNGVGYGAVNSRTAGTYLGGGQVTLFPKMNIVGKDFNPFQAAGKQFKLSYIDFQMDNNEASPAIPATTIQLFVNSYLGMQANLLNSNMELLNSSQNVGFISGASKANPCVITSVDHSLETGTLIYIGNVIGMTQLNSANYTITVINADSFSLNGIDSTGFTTYVSGGIWNTSPTDGQNYTSGAQYAWYRFYSTQFGQYLRIALTYDDVLMNQLATHQTPMELNAMNLWMREGGRLVN